MSEIPWEVIFDILCKLRVKTLFRFKCVSKQFHLLINDPGFIKLHLRYQTLKYPKFILISRYTTLHKVILYLDLLDNPVSIPSKSISLICSCDGLFALMHFVDKIPHIILWNPSTNKHKSLSDFSEVKDHYAGWWFSYAMGLGYDSATDVISSYAYPTICGFVYSLKTDSWRKIENPKFKVFISAEFLSNTLCCGIMEMVEVSAKSIRVCLDLILRMINFFGCHFRTNLLGV